MENEEDIYDEGPGGTQVTHPAIKWMRDREFDIRDVGDLPGNLSEEIREHPLRSMAIALAAGIVLSKIA